MPDSDGRAQQSRSATGNGTIPLPAVPAAPQPQPQPPLGRWGLATGLVLVLLLVVAGLWVVATGPRVTPGQATPVTGAPTELVPGVDVAERATRTDTDCEAHSYGRVKQFFAATPCAALHRALYAGLGPDGAVVISVSTVTMPDEDAAAALQRLADTDGTGNVADLLREGVRVEGGPERLSDAAYASRRKGTVVVIVEADTASGDRSTQQALADAALVLGG